MMSFGWRPMLSCYGSQQKQMTGQTTSTQQAVDQAVSAVSTGQATPNQAALVQAASTGNIQIASTCPTPTWFYGLLAIAAGAAIFKGRR